MLYHLAWSISNISHFRQEQGTMNLNFEQSQGQSEAWSSLRLKATLLRSMVFISDLQMSK
jgi:hypothetical protein